MLKNNERGAIHGLDIIFVLVVMALLFGISLLIAFS
jgi:hypothetical protein